MSDLAEQAIELVNELHTERLSYDEYLILIDALIKLQEYEEGEVVSWLISRNGLIINILKPN